MKKRILALLSSFLFIGLVAIIPSDLVAAKLASPPQPLVTTSAQQQEEIKKQIEDILSELSQARGMTDDDEVISQIDAVIEMVNKLGWLELTNQGEDALRLKYIIAENLEKLISELPLASVGMTTAAAAIPEANPLYEELVRVRAKIDRLIELETIPEAVPPPPPTITQVPETERLMVYSAKFLCGPAFGREGVQRGTYSTAVNVHNPHNGTVYLYKKAVIANREDDPRGKISRFRKVVLGPDEAIEIDCLDIHSLLGLEEEEIELTAPSQQTQTGLTTLSPGTEGESTTPSIQRGTITPISSLVRFIKGFVVIYASAPLDVVSVYTASTPVGFSLDVEYLSPSTASTLPRTPPPEEAKCPQGCRCLTWKEAEEQDFTAPCGGEMKICEYDDQQRPMRYCFEKPSEEVKCPDGCSCLTVAEAAERDLPRCPDEQRSCGTDPVTGEAKYCYELPTGECPDECVCLTEGDASAKGLTSLCLDASGAKIICDRDAQQNPMFCWKETEQVQCPQGCDCLALTPGEAEKQGLALCADIQCGTDAAGNVMYCYRKITETTCPQGCWCLTEAEAREGGYTWCQGEVAECGVDATTNAKKYCFEKYYCPRGCECLALTLAEAEKRGYTLCAGKEIRCGTDASGKAMYCYEEVTTECPQGCRCLTELEAKKLGFTLCGGKQIPCGYVVGGPQKWCYEEAVPARIAIDPTQASNLVGTEHEVTVFVYDKYGQPIPNARVYINVTGAHSFASIELTTNTDGKASFDYTGKNTGTDTIIATVGSLKATAFKEWYQRGQ